ncbi:MAG TPA: hemerythrin domain-containing protein [Tepidisphaeraceae bacterium]|nr:hemerythrin domain-containing protein [Tepidisphaeraceae bacterium]
MGCAENPDGSLSALMAALREEHSLLCERLLPAIESLMYKNAAEAGPTADDALLIRSKVLAFHADLARLFEREEKGMFPMLQRLEASTVISPCHAGMVKSRVRFAVIEQNPLTESLAKLKEATQACPAASCRGVLELLHEFEVILTRHLKLEREKLFPRAVELEGKLSGE